MFLNAALLSVVPDSPEIEEIPVSYQKFLKIGNFFPLLSQKLLNWMKKRLSGDLYQIPTLSLCDFDSIWAAPAELIKTNKFSILSNILYFTSFAPKQLSL